MQEKQKHRSQDSKQAHPDQEQPIKNIEKVEECGSEEHIGVISLQFL